MESGEGSPETSPHLARRDASAWIYIGKVYQKIAGADLTDTVFLSGIVSVRQMDLTPNPPLVLTTIYRGNTKPRTARPQPQAPTKKTTLERDLV
jgi:hypothetical protein